jgi:hypothetical protein
MIPRVINYGWFGDQSKKPIDIIEGWKKMLPGWEIKEWNESNLDIDRYRFARLAYDFGRFGIAIDPFCVEVLEREGGVWLDASDVFIHKDISPFLEYSFFAGYMNTLHLSNGVMGAEPHNSAAKRNLKWYDEFWNSTTLTKSELNPRKIEYIHSHYSGGCLEDAIRHEYKINFDGRSRTYQTKDGLIRLEAPPVFTIRGDYSVENYTEHTYAGTWVDGRPKGSYYKELIAQYNLVISRNK